MSLSIKHLLVVLSFALLAGCGGSNDDSPDTGVTTDGGATTTAGGIEQPNPENDDPEADGTESPQSGSDDDEGAIGAAEGELTEERLQVIVQSIKDLSLEAGLEYRFEIMSHTTEVEGDTTRVFFEYNEPNIAGGSPIAVISNTTSTLLQLDFYQ